MNPPTAQQIEQALLVGDGTALLTMVDGETPDWKGLFERWAKASGMEDCDWLFLLMFLAAQNFIPPSRGRQKTGAA